MNGVMRGYASVAIVGLALATVVILPLGCSSSDCKSGTIAAKVYLMAPINLDADRMVVMSIDPPGLDLQAMVTGSLSGGDGVPVELSFPHGYSPNTLLTLRGQAFAGSVL